MIYILSTCTAVLGKETEFENTITELTSIYEKYGAKTVGCWWTLGGERNEVVWLHSWKDLNAYEKGQANAIKDENYPIEKLSSLIITYTDKILKPLPSSPMK